MRAILTALFDMAQSKAVSRLEIDIDTLIKE